MTPVHLQVRIYGVYAGNTIHIYIIKLLNIYRIWNLIVLRCTLITPQGGIKPYKYPRIPRYPIFCIYYGVIVLCETFIFVVQS